MEKFDIKTNAWSVKNDGSQLFKDTVINWINHNHYTEYIGYDCGSHYGVNKFGFANILQDSFGTLLTLEEFITIFGKTCTCCK